MMFTGTAEKITKPERARKIRARYPFVYKKRKNSGITQMSELRMTIFLPTLSENPPPRIEPIDPVMVNIVMAIPEIRIEKPDCFK